MKNYYVTFRSVTFAQRGESLLRQAGFSAVLRRTPRWMEERGCGYCLRLSAGEAPGGVELLRRKQIPFRKIYLLQDGEEAEEVYL